MAPRIYQVQFAWMGCLEKEGGIVSLSDANFGADSVLGEICGNSSRRVKR